MEESIKIVEEILDGLKANRVHGQFTEEQFMKENQAIEQLIKGYRELEDANKGLRDRNEALENVIKKLEENISKDTSVIQIKAIKHQGYIEGYAERDKLAREICEECCKGEIYRNSIPKSKIKEKIEPIIDALEKDDFVGYADEIRDIMSELMEDK